MCEYCRDLIDKLDLILDSYKSLEALVAGSDIEASHLFPIIYQLNLQFDRELKNGERLVKCNGSPTLVSLALDGKAG